MPSNMPCTKHRNERRAKTGHTNIDNKDLLISAGDNSRGGCIESRTVRADGRAKLAIGFVL